MHVNRQTARCPPPFLFVFALIRVRALHFRLRMRKTHVRVLQMAAINMKKKRFRVEFDQFMDNLRPILGEIKHRSVKGIVFYQFGKNLVDFLRVL